MKKMARISGGRGPLLAGLVVAALTAQALAESPQWITYPSISPDGEMIAFTYRGQIHVVEASGGIAVPLTSQGYHSHRAVWSPGSDKIAFASDFSGDDDVYVSDLGRSPVQRLTWSSRPERPISFTPDGGTVLFSRAGLGDPEASLPPPGPNQPQLYGVDLDSGRESLVLPHAAREAVWNGDGTRLLYSYNPSRDPVARQFRVASNARQIWLYDAETGIHTRLLDGPVDVLNPLWGDDDAVMFHLSEASGRLNVWRHEFETGESTQLTDFTDHPVRYLSVSSGGDIAFTQAGGLYRLEAGAETPERLEIVIPQQIMEQPIRDRSLETTEFVSSPDGSFWGMIVDNQVFLADRSGRAVQVTTGEEPKRTIAFAPDGSMLAYAALREHGWGIYGVLLADAEGNPHMGPFEELPLVVGEGANAFQPGFSPDGQKLAFVADRREVAVLDLQTGEIATPFSPEDYNTSYADGDIWFSWSPDSSSLLASWRQVPFAVVERAGVVPADGSGPMVPLTQAVNAVSTGFWSADGSQILALTTVYGPRNIDHMPDGSGERPIASDLYRVFMSDEARSDFLDALENGGYGDDIGDYAFVPSRNSVLEGRLTMESASHIYVAALVDRPGILSFIVEPAMRDVSLAIIDLASGDIQEIADGDILRQMGVGPINGLSYVPGLNALDIQTEGGIVTIPIDHLEATQGTPLEVDHSFVPSARRAEAFEQVWADIRYKFYRSDLEGRDWDAIGATYRGYLAGVASDRELAELVSEMFGELSASHLFVHYSESHGSQRGLPTETAALGFYRDYADDSPGLVIADIVPGGPLDRESLGVGPGDRIVSLNGVAVADAGGLDRLLNGLAGRSVPVGIVSPGEEEREIVLRPISLEEEDLLTYRRWVDRRRAMVEEMAGACVVYAYMPQMDNASFLDVSSRFLAARQTAAAALLDVRSNGGGNEHRQLLALLGGTPFAQVGREDRGWDVEPLDRWIGSSAVLVDSFAYSDGSVFPQAYQDIGLGPVVGERLLNTGTGVNYVASRLIPGLVYGIPVMPFRRLDGTYYENLEIEPDIEVPFDPNTVLGAGDAQLEAAVAALMAEIEADDDCRGSGFIP